ncbi:tetratricopeptide repeat protein [Stieleria bergensis]
MASAPQETTIAEVLSMAITLHQQGDREQAETLYQHVLKLSPNNADALHFLGVLRHQQGNSLEASTLIGKALVINPSYWSARLNLGNIFKESGRIKEAEREYKKVIQALPKNADAHSNLGVVLRAQRKTQEALEYFKLAIELDGNVYSYHYNLGNAYKELGQNEQALLCYRKVIEIAPNHAEGHLSVGRGLYAIGRIEEATSVYRKWLEKEPDNAVAAHMLAACEGESVPDRCSVDFVIDSFDSFAASFDDVLGRLDYQAPALIADRLERSLPDPDKSLCVLDAGCGTGLCAYALRPYSKQLVGVDLSPKMLARARARKEYDELHAADLLQHMQDHGNTYDLIVSSDTMIYFGDLSDVIQAAAKALKPAGWLTFTLEHVEADLAPGGFRLNPHGRYSHDKQYIETCLRDSGLRLHCNDIECLRTEGKKPVDGMVILAQKQAVM